MHHSEHEGWLSSLGAFDGTCRPGQCLFYTCGTVVGSHDYGVYHVGPLNTADQCSQGFWESLEDALLKPSPAASKNTVPLAVTGREVPALRSRAGYLRRSVEEPLVIISWLTATNSLSRQERSD